jgi:hypothetical protein
LTGLLLLMPACKKAERSTQPSSTPGTPIAAKASAPSAAPPQAARPAAAPSARVGTRPTPLDKAGQRAAKAYLLALGQGRRATLAKDYAAADRHFSKCLELMPQDPRALAERGYARLLAEQLPEATADLMAAETRAPNSALKLQIVHNLLLLARKAGDDRAARAREDEEKRIKAARRLPSGVACTSNIGPSDLELRTVDSFEAALKLVVAEHAKADGVAGKDVSFAEPYSPDEGYEERLHAMAARRPFPDGAHVLWTSRDSRYRNHAVIAQAGKFYVYPNLSVGGAPLCGFEGAQVTIEGGGATPWRIQREQVSLVRGYLYVGQDGTALGAPPDDEEAVPTMGFCGWTGTNTDVTVLDAKTFRGILHLSASAQPSGDGEASGPEHILEVEWWADHAMVEACGQRKRVPYVAQ